MQYTLSAAGAVARADQVDRGFLAPLRPCLIGPRAGLHRFNVQAEQPTIAIGAYDPLVGLSAVYPGQTAGSTIDMASVKLFANNLDLRYFVKSPGSGGTCIPDTTYPNRVRASAFVFQTANGTARSGVFGDRDVQVGDIVTLSGTVTGTQYSLTSSVMDLVGDPVPASTGAATADTNNKGSQSSGATINQTTGTPLNEVFATADPSGYESTADGYVTRTYTVTVTQGSTGGDATTAVLRVVSADGGDNQTALVPHAFGTPTPVGTKGLAITWALGAPPASTSGTIDETDFVVGQQWVVTASQAFTPPTPTAAGTYTGPRTDTYIVAVTRGGSFTGTTKPQITVTTANGSDASGPTLVPAAATPAAVGSFGVTIAFAGTGLRKGDVYYVPVTAVTAGAVRTVVLRDDVPAPLRGTDVTFTLAARRQGVAIAAYQPLPTPATVWTADADGITVVAGLQLTDPQFTSGGVLTPVPVSGAALYLEYREWLTTGAGGITQVAARDAVAAALGPVDPANPLAYAADKALAHTSGELANDPTRPAATTTDVVYCVPLGGDPADESLWTAAVEVLTSNDQAYQLVPLTADPAVQAAVAAHVAAESTDASGFYRRCWLTASVNESAAIVAASTTSDGHAVTATVTATPGSSPTVYTTVTASPTALFITKGVRSGDSLRINFGTAPDGSVTYTTYLIAAVLSETSLRLVTGPTGPISIARQIEVWRTFTKAELVTQLTAVAAGFKSTRVSYVWPDAVGFGGTTLDGSVLCAALAGLAGSVPSHQGLRNVALVGFDAMPRANGFFTSAQLDALAAGGLCVCAMTPDGTPYVRADVTTDPTSVGTKEEMICRNADMVRKAVQAAWAPYVGAGNVVSNLNQLLTGALASLSATLQATANVQQLGAPVAGLSLTSLAAVPGQADAVVATIAAAGLAVPLNQIQVVLPVSA